MFIQQSPQSQIQVLRKIVKAVPTELRNMARAERQELIKMDLVKPGSASYVISHGEATKNNILKEIIRELKTKHAENFYKLQNNPIVKPSMPEVVKADMIL